MLTLRWKTPDPVRREKGREVREALLARVTQLLDYREAFGSVERDFLSGLREKLSAPGFLPSPKQSEWLSRLMERVSVAERLAERVRPTTGKSSGPQAPRVRRLRVGEE